MVNQACLGALKEILSSQFEVVYENEVDMLKNIAQAVGQGDELFAFTAEEPGSQVEFDFLGCVDAGSSKLKWLFVVDARDKSAT